MNLAVAHGHVTHWIPLRGQSRGVRVLSSGSLVEIVVVVFEAPVCRDETHNTPSFTPFQHTPQASLSQVCVWLVLVSSLIP